MDQDYMDGPGPSGRYKCPWIPPYGKVATTAPYVPQRYFRYQNASDYPNAYAAYNAYRQPLPVVSLRDLDKGSRLSTAKTRVTEDAEETYASAKQLVDDDTRFDKLEGLISMTMKNIEDLKKTTNKIEMNQAKRSQNNINRNNDLGSVASGSGRKSGVTNDKAMVEMIQQFANLLKDSQAKTASGRVTFENAQEANTKKAKEMEMSKEIAVFKELMECMKRNQDTMIKILKRKILNSLRQNGDDSPVGGIDSKRKPEDDNNKDKLPKDSVLKRKGFFDCSIAPVADVSVKDAIKSLQDNIKEKDAKIEALKVHCIKLHKFTEQMIQENAMFLQFMEEIGSNNDDVVKFRSVLQTEKQMMKIESQEKSDEIERLLKMLKDYNVDCRKPIPLKRTGDIFDSSAFRSSYLSSLREKGLKTKSVDHRPFTSTADESSFDDEFQTMTLNPDLNRKWNCEDVSLTDADVKKLARAIDPSDEIDTTMYDMSMRLMDSEQ